MKTKLVILILSFTMAAIVFAAYCTADDSPKHREHHEEPTGYGHKRKNTHDKGERSPTATNGIYAAACGGCHWAYAPQLLPKKSWENMVTSLDDHFGNKVVLSEQEKTVVRDYLLGNAADVSATKIGRKVMHSLGGATPSRVVEVPHIQRKHRKLASAVLARKGVGGLANCIACHPGAASLDFDDDSVRIPAN